MLIKQILDADTEKCHEALERDAQLEKIDDRLYSLLSDVPEDIRFDMERTISEYMARVTRIVYLQGIVDFTKLHVVLQEDPNAILQKYVDEMK